jgi:hypothetical protein
VKNTFTVEFPMVFRESTQASAACVPFHTRVGVEEDNGAFVIRNGVAASGGSH